MFVETFNTIPMHRFRIPPLPLPPPPPPPTPPPPPPPSQQSDNTLPILAISLFGILTAALLFLFYYIFVIKCWLRHRGPYRSENDPTTDYSAETGNRGLEESAIQAIPTFRFGNGIGGGGGKGSFHECAVCLNEFQEEERIRLLPNCFHIFHIDCVDTWLKTNANCPLCRSHITTTSSIAAARLMEQAIHQNLQQREEAAIDVGDGDRSMRMNGRKPHHVSSMGDECIDVGLRDEQFCTQPTRRSFSLDLSSSRQVSLAVQEILRQNPHFKEVGNGENGGSGRSERSRRHLFSFRHCQSSRSSVLPIQFDP